MSTAKRKMTQKPPKGRNGSVAAATGSGRISDARFAKFESDPRFRLPSKRTTRTKLDKRFAHMLHDEDFTAMTQVDRYGRKLKSDKKKRALERLYRVENEEDEDEEDEEDEDDGKGRRKTDKRGEDFDKQVQKELQRADEKYDPARGGGFSESETDDSDDDSSSDQSGDEDKEDGEGNAGASSKAADTQRFREEEAEVPTGEVTHRLAVVNLDWDHVKSRDLMAMFASFVPKDSGGRIERISIYPSEFGKERMQREELEGPPKEIFKSKKRDEDDSEDDDESDGSEDDDDDDDEEEEDQDDDEKVKQDLLREEDDQDFDSAALRSYQLDRLRYFYAVVVCSDPATAEAIYRQTDGREYQASSNFIDLRFVPDDVSFAEDEPRDECTEAPGASYKPVEFVTQALQHSKVKLTWDLHPEDTSRKDLMRKAFSGTPAELIENDLRAYLASDSDGEGEEEEEVVEVHEAYGFGKEAEDKKEDDGAAGEEKPKLSKKELARQKMRAALGLGDEPTKSSSSSSSKHGPVGGMQITFTLALSASSSKTKKAAADGEEAAETTLEKYKRKEKERKQKRKEKAIAKREGREVGSDGEDNAATEAAAGEDAGEDLGFDDPFFTTGDDAVADKPASKTSIRKEERLKKRAAREAEAKDKAEERARLEELMADDADQGGEHFDLREVMRAEKARKKEEKKKSKKNKNRHAAAAEDDDEMTAAPPASGFVVDVADPRFQAVFDDPEFAIDPSNPRFKATPGMQQVLNEVRRKRASGADDDDVGGAPTHKKKKVKAAAAAAETEPSSRNDELANLVNAVKRKAKKNAL